jgi:hypothetical protein
MAASAVAKAFPFDLGLPLAFCPARPFCAWNKSAIFRSMAATIADVSQLAWQVSKALPSFPSATLRLFCPSSWAGHKADQPAPDLRAFFNLDSTSSTGLMVAPFRCGRLPGQPGLQVGHGVQDGSSLAAADADARDVSVFRELPQVAGRDSQGLCRFTGAQGQGD